MQPSVPLHSQVSVLTDLVSPLHTEETFPDRQIPAQHPRILCGQGPGHSSHWRTILLHGEGSASHLGESLMLSCISSRAACSHLGLCPKNRELGFHLSLIDLCDSRQVTSPVSFTCPLLQKCAVWIWGSLPPFPVLSTQLPNCSSS